MSIADATLITMFVVALIPLVPTEPVLVGMGVLAASGHGSPVVVLILVAALGCTLSDHLLYAAGRLTGARVLARLAGRPSVDAATGWLTRNAGRWGTPILVAGRWLPAGGTAGAMLAGTLRWGLPKFTPASVVGSTLWSSYVTMLGYLGGSLTDQPITGLLLSLAVAAAVGLFSGVVVQRAHRRAMLAGEAPAGPAPTAEASALP